MANNEKPRGWVIHAIVNYEPWRFRKYRYQVSLLKDYKRAGVGKCFQVWKIHHRGFTLNDWRTLRLTKDNYKKYLSTRDYYCGHPYNGPYSDWIDDKMTLKYMLNGTELGEYMPDYYFLIDESGTVKALMDCPQKLDVYCPRDIVELLEKQGVLAFKKIKGSLGIGFFKAEVHKGEFFLNDEKISYEQLICKIADMRDYLVQEYLRPHPYFATFWPNTANTIRYAVCRIDGTLKLLKSFIRFGTKRSGSVENFNSGGVMCYINENGCFQHGYLLEKSQGNIEIKEIETHPDTGKTLVGYIPCWKQFEIIINKMDRLFPQMNYLGFDFVVTANEEIKILEINSLTSLDALQLDGSILENEVGQAMFS